MVMSEFVVPSLMFSEVKKIKEKMIEMVHAYQSKMLSKGSSAEEKYRDDEAAPFDASRHLFASTNCNTNVHRSENIWHD